MIIIEFRDIMSAVSEPGYQIAPVLLLDTVAIGVVDSQNMAGSIIMVGRPSICSLEG